MDGNYYLGLDMGASSCGWSVTDEEYHVLRRHGKALWGVRLFEGAKTAEERRMHRTGRRRADRAVPVQYSTEMEHCTFVSGDS